MRKIILIIFILVSAAVIVGLTLYNKPHRSVAQEEAIAITAAQLFHDFETNEEASNRKYLDQVIEVTGIVSEININQEGHPVILLQTDNPMFGIQCTLQDQTEIQADEIVTLKGICTGYLSDVVLTSAMRIKK